MRSQIRQNQAYDIDFISHSELDAISGTLQSGIDSKAPIVHSHPTTFLELTDTPSSYDDAKYLKSTASGIVLSSISGEDVDDFSTLQFSITPTYNGVIKLFGWNTKINEEESLNLVSGTPLESTKRGFNSYFVMNIISSVGNPFNVTVSGTVASEASGNLLQVEETVLISGTGYYKTSNSFIDAPVFNIVESGKSCLVDLYKTSYWDAVGNKFVVKGCMFEWEPDQVNWDLNLELCHVLNNGSVYIIDSANFSSTDTVLMADSEDPGKYKRTGYNRLVLGCGDEGIMIFFDQRAIGHLYFEIRYTLGESC